jgi:hypothetical protein
MRAILAALVIGLAVSASGGASAEVVYPWCAYYSGKPGGTNCGFSTFEQCQWAISGNGGFCDRNGFYTAAPYRDVVGRPHKRRHYHQ